MLERLAAGRFDVTDRPHPALCLDCPARERLCSHHTAAQMREDPDPPIGAEPQLSLLEGRCATTRLGLFGYGSLVLHESASMTLGRPADRVRPARLHDWRRRFSQRRDNLTCEKTFECAGGFGHRSGSSASDVEEGEDPAGPVNGVVIELTEAELDRLDIREIRYDSVDVSGSVQGEDLPERSDRHMHREGVPFRARATGGRESPSPPTPRPWSADSNRSAPVNSTTYLATTPYPARPPRGDPGRQQDPAGQPTRLVAVLSPVPATGPSRANSAHHGLEGVALGGELVAHAHAVAGLHLALDEAGLLEFLEAAGEQAVRHARDGAPSARRSEVGHRSRRRGSAPAQRRPISSTAPW